MVWILSVEIPYMGRYLFNVVVWREVGTKGDEIF